MNDPSLTIRPYLTSDLRAMFLLDRVCFEEAFQFSMRAMRHFAEARDALVVVATCDSLVGFAIAEVTGSVMYLVTLDVAPDWRRQGLARRLLEWLVERGKALGVERIELHVLEGNSAAVRFYKRCGFGVTGSAPGFYGPGLNALIYSASLPLADGDCPQG